MCRQVAWFPPELHNISKQWMGVLPKSKELRGKASLCSGDPSSVS